MALFTHPELGEEVHFLSGYYTLLEEGTNDHGDRRFLYLVGLAEVNQACCGVHGCRFIQVVGYPLAEKGRDAAGRWISPVEPVNSPAARAEISSLLGEVYPHSRIGFLTFPD